MTNALFTPLTYSIHAFLWWDGGEVGTNLDWVRMMRFSHVKQTVAWRDIQSAPDAPFDFSRIGAIVDEVDVPGLQLIARLVGTPDWAFRPDASPEAHDTPPLHNAEFGAYCGALAGHFKGRIRAYQIWNEPNLAREWGGFVPSAAEYVGMLAACSTAIRAADPDAILISAGLSPTGNDDAAARRDDLYLQDLYDAQFQTYIDVVGAHAAGYDAPEVGPDDAVAKGGQRWMSFRRVEDLRKIMIANGDAARQMALLEVGWTTNPIHPDYAWYAVTPEQQAEYLRGAYAYAAEHWRPWVGLMSAIFLADPTWTENDEEYWFAITQPQEDQGFRFIAVRPAFDALLRMEKVCGDIVLPAYPTTGETPLQPENPCQ
ncbi:MAG: hypothetical protein IPK52_18235 [Chloroflexi bacterium]|nr:hypothetical protein [Chloroflexota bacterium]